MISGRINSHVNKTVFALILVVGVFDHLFVSTACAEFANFLKMLMPRGLYMGWNWVDCIGLGIGGRGDGHY